jgi:predicted small lipoprotein YifL
MCSKELMSLKKIISIMLVLILAFTLGACGDKNNPDAHNHNDTEQEDPNKVTGMIYGVSSADKSTIVSTEFSCNGGVVTPERISAGLSGWTGLKFRVNVETDDNAKTIRIDWLDESSINESTIPDTIREDFSFATVKDLRVFMLNSLCYSIHANLGDSYDIFYTVNGEDISTLGIEGLSSDTAFNKTDSEFVFVK